MADVDETDNQPVVRKKRIRPSRAKVPGRKRGMTPFVPDEQQRHVVSMCAGVKMGHKEIAGLILNPRTRRPINEETLVKHFSEELANGNGRLKLALSMAFFKLVAQCSEHSVLFGMRTMLGFDDRNVQPMTMTMNDGDRSMRIEFVVPGKEGVTQLEDIAGGAKQGGRAVLPPRSEEERRQEWRKARAEEGAKYQAFAREAGVEIKPEPTDVVLNKAGTQPNSWDQPFGAYRWMK